MKQNKDIQTTMLILVLFMAFMLTNCAPKSSDVKSAEAVFITTPGACANSPVVGKWVYNGNTITINDDCTGSSSVCNYEFTYPTTILSKPHTTLTFTKADVGPACKKVGDNLINIEFYNKGSVNEILYINDGFSEANYLRSK